jgi:heme a synthase
MLDSDMNPWLRRYAFATALATLVLVGIGGVVTSRGVGMAVPDWPTTYGYNMFFFPVSKWVGGVFYEHTHRLVASFVGLLVVGLTRWLGGRASRLPLALIGTAEVFSGLALIRYFPGLSGTGHFLSGIGGVVLLAALVWVRNAPAPKPLPTLGWIAFGLVQFQGLLGGLRVVLYKDQIGVFHGTLAQLFFALLCAVSLFTTRWWQSNRLSPVKYGKPLRGLCLAGTLLILLQLVLGATMRHQHAGLAIPDFPLAYGKLWPDTDPGSVELYNQRRIEVIAVKPITSAQILLQMVHRVTALGILALVTAVAWSARHQPSAGESTNFANASRRGRGVTGLTRMWLSLVLLQVLLGAATIWSNKAADIATAHVLVGSLSLALGSLLCVILLREPALARKSLTVSRYARFISRKPFGPHPSPAEGGT